MQEHEHPTPGSPLMLLLTRLNDAQIDQGRALSKAAEDQHEIKTSLAIMNARLEPLTALHREMTELGLASQRHRDQLEANGLRIRTLEGQVLDLTAASNRRHGWETFGGKLVYVMGGGAFATVLTLVVQALR